MNYLSKVSSLAYLSSVHMFLAKMILLSCYYKCHSSKKNDVWKYFNKKDNDNDVLCEMCGIKFT